MHQENATIRQFSRSLSPNEKLRRQIRAVLLAMSALTLAVTVTAFFIAGPKAMLAALMGGLSQIVAVLVYARVARSNEIPQPKAILALHMAAEIAKIVVMLILMLVGTVIFGTNAVWFLGAFVVALAAYWLVLIFK